MPHSELPFPNAYWVIPDQIMAGEYPGAADERQTHNRLLRLLACGITCIIDLTMPGEEPPYQPTLEAMPNEKKVQYHRRSIHDFGLPNQKLMRSILDIIDQAERDGDVVYLHCRGGIGRTGTVVGCYLVRHGMSGDEAMERIANLRHSTADWWFPSPETDSQVNFILDWTKDQ